MANNVYAFRDVQVHYDVAGEGEPVMLVHGFGEDRSIWHQQVSHLKNKFRLIVPDIPGSGDTELLKADASSGFIIDLYAEVLKGILDQEAISEASVIGHSMGGYIALAFAANYPDRLNGLGLFHSTAFADSSERISMRRKGIEFIRKHGAEAFLRQSIPNLFAQTFLEKHPEKVSDLMNKSGNFSADSLVQYYEAMMQRPDRTDVLRNCRKPVLFISGEEDKSVYLQDSLKQFHLPSVSIVKIFKNVAHMGMWEREIESNSTLDKFLNYIVDG